MATTSVEILFVGLCSFLNMKGQVSYMPPPSVVLQSVPGPSMKHEPFIAWDDQTLTLDNAASFKVRHTRNGTAFLNLEGEELVFNDDQSKGPTVPASFDTDIPTITHYGDLATTPLFNPTHVPDKGNLSALAADAAYIEFGNGAIASDWPTEKKYIFRDANTTANPHFATAANYNRRVKYDYTAASDALVIVARKFDNSARRKLVFRPKTGSNVTVWIGNSMDIDEDMMPTPPISNKTAQHFSLFYNALLVPTKIYVPVIEGGFTPPSKPSGGAGTGYCGPDNLP